MKKLIALLIGIAFVAGLSGSVLAQGTTTAPKEGTKMDKPAEKPAGEMKKPAAHNANGTVNSAVISLNGSALLTENDFKPTAPILHEHAEQYGDGQLAQHEQQHRGSDHRAADAHDHPLLGGHADAGSIQRFAEVGEIADPVHPVDQGGRDDGGPAPNRLGSSGRRV